LPGNSALSELEFTSGSQHMFFSQKRQRRVPNAPPSNVGKESGDIKMINCTMMEVNKKSIRVIWDHILQFVVTWLVGNNRNRG
jgi:hypothetical protein